GHDWIASAGNHPGEIGFLELVDRKGYALHRLAELGRYGLEPVTDLGCKEF
ncbi:hypothetical protein JF818_15105, partial [Sphaerochaeta sp. S2]|nr:hypothetical protein [Sphaerochaeta sp. S2]